MVETAEFVCSVAKVKWPGFRDAQRRLDRFEVAHFADQHHVGIFTQARRAANS